MTQARAEEVLLTARIEAEKAQTKSAFVPPMLEVGFVTVDGERVAVLLDPWGSEPLTREQLEVVAERWQEARRKTTLACRASG